MMEKKTFAIIFVVAFGFLTYYLWQNNDVVAKTIVNDGLQGFFWYFISNFNYVLILISIIILDTDVTYLRRIFGGILTIYAFDIVSYPRLSLGDIINPNALNLSILASSDGLVINELLKFGLTPYIAYTTYYLIFPILFIGIALYVLGFSNFLDGLFSRK